MKSNSEKDSITVPKRDMTVARTRGGNTRPKAVCIRWLLVPELVKKLC